MGLQRQCTDADYFYEHHCIEFRINSLLNPKIFLIKAMTKRTMLMHVCVSKIGMHCLDFKAKSGPYYYPPREYSMMTCLQSHVLNIPGSWTTCTSDPPCLPSSFPTNLGETPDWVVLHERNSGSPKADSKISTRLPIPEGHLHMDSSRIGNGQSGERPDSPSK
jgi:hypothetical protein